MAKLAVHRDRHARANEAVHAGELILGGMAGNVNKPVALPEDADAAANELIAQAGDRQLVAGNDARREDDRIALVQTQLRVIVGRQPGERRSRLALAAGADDE